jgi:ABC-2 type transport system permease protein
MPGFTKSQEGANGTAGMAWWHRLLRPLLGWLPVTRREFVFKDLKVFFRDATQWSQLILLAVLLIVYVFNIRALPLYTGERVPYVLVTLVVFPNQGLGGFVLAAIAARFIFPSVSLEGRQLWLLRSSPLICGPLWSKYCDASAAAVCPGDRRGHQPHANAPPFMMLLSTFTTVCYTLPSALRSAWGAFPQFDSENAAQIPTSFGGLVFMMAAVSLLTLIIVIEAVPVAQQLRAWQAGEPPGSPASLLLVMTLVFLVCALATVLPLRIGLRRLAVLEE